MADDNIEQNILVRIVAQIDGLLGGMKGAAAGVKETTTEMKASLSSLSTVVDSVKKPFLALTALLAGGKIFKDAINATQEWTYSSVLLGRQLGITAEDASVLKVALDDIYVSSESYSHAVQMMTRNIAAGGKGFERLGIDTKDANGNLKSSGALMTEVLAKLNGLKEGTDRNVAGTAIFSRSWGEASKLLKLNATVMEEARQKAERLNLIVGQDAVEASMRYKAAMQEQHDIMEGLRITIGKNLLPILTALSEWMSQSGPTAIEAASNVMKGFVQVIYTLQYALNQVGNILVGVGALLFDLGSTFAKVIDNIARGNIVGAFAAASTGANNLKADWTAALATMSADTDALVKKTNELWNPAKRAAKIENPGTDTFDPDKGDQDKILQKFKLQLEELKAKEENWFTWSEARELAFWREKLAGVKKGTAAYAAVLTEVNRLRREIQTKEKEEQKKVDDEMKGLMEDAVKSREAILLEGLTLEEGVVAQRRASNEISAEQEIAALLAIENRKYEIRREALLAQLQIEHLTALQIQQLHEQLDLLAAQHATASAGIAAKGMKDISKEAAALFGPLTSAWNSALAGMLANTKSFSQAIGEIWLGLGRTLDKMIMDSLNNWIAGEAKKLAVYVAGKLKMLTVHTATNTAAAASTAATATAQVGSEAAVAGAGAAASASVIPGIGWLIAIPAALAVIGSVMAMRHSIASAAGGWGNIPNDQLAMVHKNEMVLPAPLAGAVRDMANRGGPNGGQMTVNISAMDAASFHDFAKQNKAAFASVIRDLVRNGALTPART